jgi:hypothetical protein
MIRLFATILLGIILFSCGKKGSTGEVTGWRPVYASDAEYKMIRSLPPQPIVNAGKIAYAAGRLFMVEKNKGVHIVQYTDPASPKKERFLEIPGCYEVSYKGGYLIVNNGSDLVSLDISQPGTVMVASRLPKVFRSIQEAGNIPPDAVAGEYFECPDFSRGVILRWEKATLREPACKTLP